MAKFELQNPVTPVHVNQQFGEDPTTYSRFGIQGHNGIDFRASHGQPVYAAHDGTAYYEIDDDQGHGVVVISDYAYAYGNNFAHYKTIYWHFCDPNKEPIFTSPIYKAVGRRANSGVGVHVKAGDLLGYADSTGFSNGDHLHFGLKPIVPGPGVSVGDAPDVGIGNWVNVSQENGYKGAIDPAPYFATPLYPIPADASVSFGQAVRNLLAGGLSGNLFANALDILKKKYNQ